MDVYYNFKPSLFRVYKKMMNELSLHILDVCQNSITADASLVEILVHETIKNNEYHIQIKDDGHGMSKEVVNRISNPVYSTHNRRDIPHGLTLLKMAVDRTDGTFMIKSKEDIGTTIHAVFPHDHMLRYPLGTIEDTIMVLLLNEKETEIYYKHTFEGQSYIFDSRKIKNILDGVSLQEDNVIQWIKKYIRDGIIAIQKNKL